MKFQNSSMHSSYDMACIKESDKQTHGQMDNPKPICLLNFFEVGDIKKLLINILTILKLDDPEKALYIDNISNKLLSLKPEMECNDQYRHFLWRISTTL